MTNKHLFTWFAAVIICCMATFTVTSCSVDDSAVYPDEEIDYKLTGYWTRTEVFSLLGQTYILKLLINFDSEGTIRAREVIGCEGDDLEDWDCDNRHYIYMFDKNAKTLTVVDSHTDALPDLSSYKIVDGELVLVDLEYSQEYIFHRPSLEEKNEFDKYDVLNGSDFMGCWMRTYEENGQTTYELASIYYRTTFTRYTVTANGKVYKSTELKYMDDYYMEDFPRHFTFYDPITDEETDHFWWKVENRTLYLGNYGEQETRYTYHELTKQQYKMFVAFDQTAEITDVKEKLPGEWELYKANDEAVDLEDRHYFTYDADGTVYYTPSLNALKEMGIWGHHFKGTYTVSGNSIEQQVTVADKNIVFTQKTDVKSIESIHIETITNAETQVDGESRHVVKNLRETWDNITGERNYIQSILGRWQGQLESGDVEEFEKDKQFLLEFKDDGTLLLSIKNDQGAWEPVERTVSDYFVINQLLYTRWQNAGSDKTKYRGWDLYIDSDEVEVPELYMHWVYNDAAGESHLTSIKCIKID